MEEGNGPVQLQRALEVVAEIPAAASRQVEIWPILHEAEAKM